MFLPSHADGCEMFTCLINLHLTLIIEPLPGTVSSIKSAEHFRPKDFYSLRPNSILNVRLLADSQAPYAHNILLQLSLTNEPTTH